MTQTPSVQEVYVLSELVNLVRSGRASTRPELEVRTGLGRKVVTQRIQDAFDRGILAEGDLAPSAQGRPSRTVRFNAGAGLIVGASLGGSECRTAVTDLSGALLLSDQFDCDVADGPDAILPRIQESFERLLRRAGPAPVWGIGIGVPGPVDVATGRIINPPMMPGWDGIDVRAWFRTRWDAPIWVDNDVNLAAYAEYRFGHPHEDRDLLYLKVGTGIGSGLVSGGRLQRGDTGAAGEIGHARVVDDDAIPCRCGRVGCLEAVAGGWAMLRSLTEVALRGCSPVLAEHLRARGHLATEDIGLAAAAGDPATLAALSKSARVIGETAANIINFANPGVVVVGGGVLRIGETFMTEFEQTVRSRTVELATRRLVIRSASLNYQEGVIGAALLAIERLFQREAMALWIAQGTPLGTAARLHALHPA